MAVVCQRPTFAACPGRSEPHGGGCYDVYAHPDDRAGFEAAQKVCERNGGGHLVQVRIMMTMIRVLVRIIFLATLV